MGMFDLPDIPTFQVPDIPEFGTEINLAEFSGFVDVNQEFNTRYIKPPITKDIPDHLLKYEYAEDLAKDIVIEKGGRHFVIINGSFIFGDFIEALIVRNNWHVKKMTISTLSLSQNNVDSMANLLGGNFVDELNLIISAYFFSHERHNLIEYMYDELDKDNKFQLAVAGTHCKTCIFETHCGKFVVIHGSANLRTSANIEQIMIEENEILYNFNNDYQDSIISKYKTIQKPIRVNKLWKTIKNDGIRESSESDQEEPGQGQG
jgi:hypothetical protein